MSSSTRVTPWVVSMGPPGVAEVGEEWTAESTGTRRAAGISTTGASGSRRGGRGGEGGVDGSRGGRGNQHQGVGAEVFPVIGRPPPIRRPPIRRFSWRLVASLQLPSVEDHLDARVLQELTANP